MRIAYNLSIIKNITKERINGRFKMKKQKGITLIALVITIIVLLILAGVSINLVIGENGILKQAQNAIIKHKQKSAEEKIEMEISGSYDAIEKNIIWKK